MDSNELRLHLNKVKLNDLKDFLKKYNLHYKIKLTLKKTEIIDAIINHFNETDGILAPKPAKFDMPHAEEKKEHVIISTESNAERQKYIIDNKMKLLKIDNDKFKELKTTQDKLYNKLKKLKEDTYKTEEHKLIKKGVNITDKVSDNIMKLVSDNIEVKELLKIQDIATNKFQDFMEKSNEIIKILHIKKPLSIKQINIIYKTFDLNTIPTIVSGF